uniref:ATP synthase subunit a n=1 Tax=Liposcelis nr. bostrychophila AZ TaxID=1643344 RepID=A0A0F6QHE4_9NEOP|nr:ATP synthase F0 subunit 6 [Liposcelis nr. bostrychophila AZ]
MMMSLFAIFDPSSNLFLVNNWNMFFLFLLVNKTKMMNFNNMNVTLNLMKKMLMSELKLIINSKIFCFLLSIFFFIMMTNLSGLLPFVFTLTSHLSVSLSMSALFWASIMFSGWYKYNMMFSHLVPLGCPNALMPFMVLIESISQMIRPLTLSVRLSANIIAGHMIMSLLSMSSMKSNLIFFLSLMVEMLITVLEVGVALIQPYVFFILLALYSQEIN